ncbi:ATP-binding protein [Sulfurivermis fontis]|uniref:ATP-binding protein n=1 Tax=Sulfurivermis fontis TaxID=1972068 RepID=UPI0015584790|nr:ATP-binding protein [Sulfurivermis fontis]
MLPPAPDWRRKLAAFRRHHLLPAVVGLILSLALLALISYLAWQRQSYVAWLVVVQLIAVLVAVLSGAVLLRGVQRQLVEPFAQLRDWATRMRNGNVAARLPQDGSGEFAALADDLNNLGSSLQSLTQNLEAEVRRQTEHIAQKTHSLQVLYDVAASLNASRDLKDLLTRFLYTMRDIVNAKAGTVRLLIDDDQMELVASIGLDDEVVSHERVVPVKRCLCGNAVDEGEVLFQQDLLPCQQFVGRPLLNNNSLGMIAVPLQYRGKSLGVYNLFIDKSEFEARDEVKALFTSIGRHLGMAIEKARLDSESKRLSIMQERNTLAHELHDSLAQTLASLRFQVSMLPSTLSDEGTAAASREIEQIKNGLDEAYTELRELLAHFRAPIDARGLLPAIEDMVSQFRKQTGIHTFLQKEWDSTRLPANLEMQVLRIVQEALANIRKHSQAQNVRIMLRCNAEGQYRVLIEDDGVGMREPAFSGHPGEHIGLSIMQERARYLGGELRIESEEGEGTRVLLTFRYPDPKQHKEQQRFALI